MTLNFNKIYKLHEIVTRKSLEDYFWPVQERNYAREELIQKNKKEAWFCNFLNFGLTLDITLLILEEDYPKWKSAASTHNSNTTSSSLTFNDTFEYIISDPQLKLSYSPLDAEEVRKTIYVSQRFDKSADQIWAAQFFMPGSDRKQMYYMLGFNRMIEDTDLATIEKIKSDLKLIKSVTLLD